MGSHAKPRTTGRKTALGALAVGATLTGVGLTAAALDPATAVLTADSGGGNAAIQLSGLANPVTLSSASITGSTRTDSLSGVPSAAVNTLANPARAAAGTVEAATTRTKQTAAAVTAAAPTPRTGAAAPTVPSTPAASAPAAPSAPAVQPATSTGSGSAADPGSGLTAIRPIQQGLGALTDGYTGKHRLTRSAAAPSADPVAAVLQSATSTAAGLTGEVTGVAGSLPLVGQLLGGSGDGQTTLTVPGLSSLVPGGAAGSAGPLSALTSALPAGL